MAVNVGSNNLLEGANDSLKSFPSPNLPVTNEIKTFSLCHDTITAVNFKAIVVRMIDETDRTKAAEVGKAGDFLQHTFDHLTPAEGGKTILEGENLHHTPG